MTIIKLNESGNLNCVFTTTREADGTWKHVSKCGVTRRSPPEYPTFNRRCESGGCLPDPPAELLAEDARPKSITAKAWSFYWAQVRWIKAGRPKREQAEVDRILEICKACPLFQPSAGDPNRGTCKACGCALNQKGGMLNKISMATESCPKEKW
jgi:hypothetical protein